MTSYPLLLHCAVRTTPSQVKTVTSPSLYWRVPSLIPRCNCRQERRRGPTTPLTLHMYKYTEKLQKNVILNQNETQRFNQYAQRQHRFHITLYLRSVLVFQNIIIFFFFTFFYFFVFQFDIYIRFKYLSLWNYFQYKPWVNPELIMNTY